jgi:DnaK suppressor protein
MATRKKTNVSKKKAGTPVAAKKTSRLKTGTRAARPSVKAKKGTKTAKPAVAKRVTGKKTPAKRAVVSARKDSEKKGTRKEDRLRELRKSLIKRREAIIRETKEEIAKYVSGEARQLVDTALDDGDWAVVDVSEDLNLSRLTAQRKTLHDIDESLRKIDEGTYGICEECGEEISEKRLSVLPTATLCLSCKENKEQFEALEKEGTV